MPVQRFAGGGGFRQTCVNSSFHLVLNEAQKLTSSSAAIDGLRRGWCEVKRSSPEIVEIAMREGISDADDDCALDEVRRCDMSPGGLCRCQEQSVAVDDISVRREYDSHTALVDMTLHKWHGRSLGRIDIIPAKRPR